MIGAAATAASWLAAGGSSGYPFGIEPMFPALAVAAACLLAGVPRRRPATITG
jgi:hypothetical protein